MSADASLELLIQIREELAGLNRTRQGLREGKKEAESFGQVLKQGLGIGGGMELARRGIDLLREGIRETVGEAFRLANEVKDGSEALNTSAEAYQVVKRELSLAGVEMGRFTMAVSGQTQSLADARTGAGAAAQAYKDLGLKAAELEKMTPEQRAIAVARAVFGATDQTRAFQAASNILGSRGLPQLLNGLRNLAENGYDKVADAAKKAGLVMSEDTVARLDAAEKNIQRLKDKATIATGEMIGAADMVQKSFAKDWWGTLKAAVLVGPGGLGMGNFAATVAGNQPAKPATPPPAPSVPANARPEDILNARIGVSDTRIQAIQNSALLTEYEKRQALNPLLRAQIDLYTRLAKAKFGDNFDADRTALSRKADDGALTEAELARLKEMEELEAKIRTAKLNRLENVDTPLAALGRELADTAGYAQRALSQGLGQTLDGLVNDIVAAQRGTQSWADSFRNLGSTAAGILQQIIVKLLVIQAINAVLGIFGYELGGPKGVSKLGTPSVKAAGGGSFVTSGRTHFEVGDNPGGVELVNVIPLSGVGRSTINGQSVRMGGGGAALVAGAGAANSGAGIVVNLVNNFSTGVVGTVRAEMINLMPQFRAVAVDAVQEAQMRNKLRL